MNTEKDEVKSVDKSGNPVKKRISNGKTAHALFKTMKETAGSAAVNRARLLSLYNRNPPLSNAELRRRGLAWTMNVDWGEFRQTINNNTTSAWNMFCKTDILATFSTAFKDTENPGKNYGMILSRAFTEVIKEWDNFHFNLVFRLREMLLYGYGTAAWPDEHDWRSMPIRAANILFPAKTKSSVGGMTTVIVRQELELNEVFDKIDNEEYAKAEGWNILALKKRLIKLYHDGDFPGGEEYQGSEWESAYSSIKNMDDNSDKTFEPFRIANLFTFELSKSKDEEDKKEDKRITHQIIMENDDDEKDLLFEKERGYKKISEVIHVMMYDIGDGYLKSVDGLGRELYYPSHASNRIVNSIVDGITISAGIMVQGDTHNSSNKLAIMRKGPVTVVSPDLHLQQQQMMPNVQAAAQVRSLINALKNNNVGEYTNQNENINNVERTAREVEIQSVNESTFKTNQAEWYYVQHESWLRETFRRLMTPDYPEESGGYEEHKAFIQTLKDEGFPKELLKFDSWKMKAKRSIGAGSASMALSFTNQMVKMKGALDEFGRHEVDRAWFAERVGTDNVDLYVPPVSREDIITFGHTMAEGENVDMQNGSSRSVAVTDPHKNHVDMHLKWLMGLIKQFMTGKLNPQQLKQTMDAVGFGIQHIGMHLAELDKDQTRSNQVKEYTEALKEIMGVHKRMGQQMEQIVRAQQQEAAKREKTIRDAEAAAKSREHELAVREIDHKAALEKYKADQLNESRMMKLYTSMKAQIEETNAKIKSIMDKSDAEVNAINRESGE